jgi:hypothetical protein
MQKTIWAGMLALAAFVGVSAGAGEARADWGLHNGDTLRGGDNMLYGEAGWPELVLGFQHGMSDKVDLGFRFAFIYGNEYTPHTLLGLGMRVPIRITPIRRDKFSFMFHIDPGIKFDSFGHSNRCLRDIGPDPDCVLFGITFPLGVDFGFHITREATLSFGMEIPFYVNLTNGVYGAIPILFGPAFEYHVDDHIALGLNTKFGPSIGAYTDAAGNVQNGVDFGFITSAFFGYRL